MNQARALGHLWHATLRTPIHAIYASDLKRAHTTAIELAAPRRALPAAHPLACPAVRTSPLIREQHFGRAEGKRWSDAPARRAPAGAHTHTSISTSTGTGTGTHARDDDDDDDDDAQEDEVYETIRNRHDRFPGGESLDDLARRAEAALDALLWPHLDDAAAYRAARPAGAGAGAGEGAPDGGEGGLGYHVVFVSHGLCISEMVAAVLRRGAGAGAGVGIRLRGLVNTGWTRLQIRPLVRGRSCVSLRYHLPEGSPTGKWCIGYFYRRRQSSTPSRFCCE